MKPFWNLVIAFALTLDLGCAPNERPRHDAVEFDAGAIFIDGKDRVFHTFKFTNSTKSDVKIKEILKTCTCTSASISKTVLTPGETADLELSVNIRPIFNKWTISCEVVTDHPDKMDRSYTLTYRTYPRVRFDEDAIQLGDVTVRGENNDFRAERETLLEVYEPADSEPDELIGVDSRGPVLITTAGQPEIELIEKKTVRRSRYTLRVSLEPKFKASIGTRAENIVAKTKQGFMASAIATWSVEPLVTVTPSNISFGMVGTDGAPQRKVLVKSTDGRSFRIQAVNGDKSEVEVDGIPSASASTNHIVVLNFRRRSEAKRFVSGKTVLTTDHPEMPRIEIDWSAIMKASAMSAPVSGGVLPDVPKSTQEMEVKQ